MSASQALYPITIIVVLALNDSALETGSSLNDVRDLSEDNESATTSTVRSRHTSVLLGAVVRQGGTTLAGPHQDV